MTLCIFDVSEPEGVGFESGTDFYILSRIP